MPLDGDNQKLHSWDEQERLGRPEDYLRDEKPPPLAYRASGPLADSVA